MVDRCMFTRPHLSSSTQRPKKHTQKSNQNDEQETIDGCIILDKTKWHQNDIPAQASEDEKGPLFYHHHVSLRHSPHDNKNDYNRIMQPDGRKCGILMVAIFGCCRGGYYNGHSSLCLNLRYHANISSRGTKQWQGTHFGVKNRRQPEEKEEKSPKSRSTIPYQYGR